MSDGRGNQNIIGRRVARVMRESVLVIAGFGLVFAIGGLKIC
jgi:hypothetical protein